VQNGITQYFEETIVSLMPDGIAIDAANTFWLDETGVNCGMTRLVADTASQAFQAADTASQAFQAQT